MKCAYQIAPWLVARRRAAADGHLNFWAAASEAFDDIAAAGWDGVEISQPPFEAYYCRPEAFRRRLAMRGLELATYYLAKPFDEMTPAQARELARPRCEFHRSVGAKVMALDGCRRGERPTERRIRAAAASVNAVARLAHDYGLITPWHIHYGSMFEVSAVFDRFMELTDPDLVTVCPDTAQMALGDYDLVAAFEKYAERITYVHFKDIAFHDGRGGYLAGIPRGVKDRGAWGPGRSADIVDTGCGAVDVARLYAILKSAGYRGWIVVDQDYSLTTPLASARRTRGNLSALIAELPAPA